ncbi:MAG: BatA domain-containing protein [Cyclobacteriaceae bacterium]|nr:BatA domain-containing protein [Cyclobacteriaceae bacterium]
MSFLQPTFLYGLLALAIPLIIHLFNFRRTKKVYFSNSQFLRQVKESKSAKQKLKHLLVLASRLLFIAFLVLAFAQPFIPSDEIEEQSDRVYIYLDNSLSMGNEVASNLTALNLGIQSVEKILDLYPREARFKLLTNDFSSPLRVFRSKEEIRDLVTEIKLNGVQRNFKDIWQRLTSEASSQAADWYFISDFQKTTFSDIQSFTADSTQRYFMVPLAFTSTANVFIDSVYLKNPFLIANDQNNIEIVMQNTGSEQVRDLVISLSLDDRQIANAGINIPAKGSATTNISLNFPLEGINPAKLSFEEFPVAFDNDFYFNLNLSQKVSILEIREEPENSVISKVYANDLLFNFQSYLVDNLDYSNINQANLVVLNALEQMPASLVGLMQDFISDGGSLVIIPHQQPDLVSIQQLATWSDTQAYTDTTWIALESPRFNHPFFSNIFEEQSNQAITMPRVKNVIKWSASRGENLLISKAGIPYLSSDYSGRIYLLGTPLDDDYSNLAQHAVFVPVMYKVAALSKAFDRSLYYTTDQQVIKVTLDSLNGNELFKLDNGTEQIIPNQRVQGQDLFLEVPSDIIQPGFYQLKSDDQLVGLLPYNNNREESILDQYQYEELQQLLGSDNVKIMDEDQFTDYTTQVVEARSGTPLWKYALILALIFLLMEVLLIRFLK